MRRYFGFILLVLISLIPLFDLFHPGLPITHDGQDHVARIANFYQNLSEGNIIPRWAAHLNWGYGHPILMFLYPLPSYVASVFHLIGFSLIDSTKIVFGIAFIASGLAMYLWIRNFLGEEAGIIASVLYMFAPYRFVDLYVRGAFGEHVAFVFPPLILYFLLKLSKIPPPRSPSSHLGGVVKRPPRGVYWYVVGGSFSLVGLILAHNAITLMFLPFIFFYGTLLIITSRNKIPLIYQYTGILVLGFGLSSFFWFPAFFEGKYTLRDIVTKGEFSSRFVPLEKLFDTTWSYGGSGDLSKQIGIAQLMGVVGSLLFANRIFKKDKRIFVLLAIILIYFLISVFLILEQSKFVWEAVTTLQKFQFPWRFLSVTVFTTAVLGAFLLFELIGIKQHSPGRSRFATPSRWNGLANWRGVRLLDKRGTDGLLEGVVVLGFMLLVLVFNKDYWHANGYLNKPDSFFKDIYHGTTDTGESSPIWSVRFMEKEPEDSIEVIEGNAYIRKLQRTSTFHRYKVTSATERARLRENTLYFPGWKVSVDGKEPYVEFQDALHRGLMTFYVRKGTHEVVVKFEETKLRSVANAVSLFSLLGMVGFGIAPFFLKR